MGDVSVTVPCKAVVVERVRRNDVARTAVILTVSWTLYSTVRVATNGSADVARANAELVRSVQQTLGIGIEAAVQRAVLDETVALIANSYYLLHFPVTVLVLGVVFIHSRRVMFPVVRDGLVLMTFVGLVVHLVFPLAPPRMLEGIIDASTMHGPNPYDLPGSGSANQFAAMPSMHVAWAIVAGWVLAGLRPTGFARVVAVLHPALTIFVVVVTGHHFVLDAVAGIVLAVGALAATSWLHGRSDSTGDNLVVVHSSSTVQTARNRAISPSYPLVSHKPLLAPLTVCTHPSNERFIPVRDAPHWPHRRARSIVSHPSSKLRTCNSPP